MGRGEVESRLLTIRSDLPLLAFGGLEQFATGRTHGEIRAPLLAHYYREHLSLRLNNAVMSVDNLDPQAFPETVFDKIG